MKRIPSLDGLRAISITMVCLGHLTHAGPVPKFLGPYSYTGVLVFFVISGYLITTILLEEHSRTSSIDLRQFYVRRAYRILPAAAVFTVLICAVYWRELRWFDIGAMLLYLVNFDLARPWMINHLWSLSVEEQFYLLWPTVLRKWYRQRIAILVGTVLLAPVFSTVLYYFKFAHGGWGIFPVVADNLAIGCLLAILSTRIPRIPGWAAALMLLAVVLIPSFGAVTKARTLVELFVLGPILHGSIAGLVLHVVRSPYRILNSAPVMWLGRISYSLYLWQQLFFYAQSRQPTYTLLFALGLACLSYYLVEQPMLRLRQNKVIAASRESSAAAD